MSQLVGRSTEVAQAIEVVAGNKPELAVLIEGAPGIGKTVVLEAAIDAAASAGALVLQTRPREAEMRMPLLGLHDLLGPVIPDALRSLSAPQRSRLETALGIAAATDGADVDEGKLAVAVLHLLRGLAARRRVVLAIDDLQWLDASTAAVLDVALGRLREANVRLLATARHGTESGRLSIERLFRDRHVRLDLRGLALGELHRLIADRLERPLPRPTLVRIHEITRGNPLHALELARSLGTAEPGGGGLNAALPADVGALLRHRIEQLDQTAQQVVAVVALSPRPSNETVAASARDPHGRARSPRRCRARCGSARGHGPRPLARPSAGRQRRAAGPGPGRDEGRPSTARGRRAGRGRGGRPPVARDQPARRSRRRGARGSRKPRSRPGRNDRCHRPAGQDHPADARWATR